MLFECYNMGRMDIKKRWEFHQYNSLYTGCCRDSNFKLQVKSCMLDFLELTILRIEIQPWVAKELELKERKSQRRQIKNIKSEPLLY